MAAPRPDCLHQEADWIAALRQAVERDGLRVVANQVGRAKSTLSYVLSGTYTANTRHIEERVRGVLMNKRIECPVLGAIPPSRCQDEQAKPFSSANPTRVELWKACHSGCPHFKGRK